MALEAFFVLIFRILGRGSVFVVLAILSRTLSLEDLGVYGLVTVTSYAFVYVVSGGLRHASAYFIGKGLAGDRVLYRVMFVYVSVIGALCSVGIFFIAPYYFGQGYDTATVVLVSLAFIPLLFMFVFQGIFLGRGEIGNFNRTEIFARVLNLVLILIIVISGRDVSLLLSLIAFVSSNTVGAIFALYLASPRAPVGLHKSAESYFSVFSRMVRYGLPLSMALALVAFSPAISMHVAKLTVGVGALGAIYLAYKLSDIVSEAATAMGMVAFSHGVRATSGRRALFSSLMSAWMVALIGCVAGGFMITTSDFLANIMLNAPDVTVPKVISIIGLGLPFLCYARVVNPSLAAQGFGTSGALIQGMTLVLNAAGEFVLGGAYGAEGIAMALTLSRVISAMAFAFVVSRVLRVAGVEAVLPRRRVRTVIVGRVNVVIRKVLLKVRGALF
jgi:O-antigen/teichoic acid export membrane protein